MKISTVVLILAVAGCSGITSSERPRIGEIHAVGCQPDRVAGNIGARCLDDRENPIIEIAHRPAGPDSMTVFVVYAHNSPDSARFFIDVWDRLEDRHFIFIALNPLHPGSLVADTLAVPAVNHIIARIVEVRLALTIWKQYGSNVTPLADTVFVWEIEGQGPIGNAPRSLFRSDR